MSGSWAVPHAGARRLPGGSKHVDRAPDTLVGVREDYDPTPEPITYVDGRDGGCRYMLAGIRCPGHIAHRGAHGARMRTETGLDFYVTWQPLAAQQRDGVDPDVIRTERDLDVVWALVACPICGNEVKPAERAAFLRDRAHVGCLADEAHDLEVHFDAEEHFA